MGVASWFVDFTCNYFVYLTFVVFGGVGCGVCVFGFVCMMVVVLLTLVFVV